MLIRTECDDIHAVGYNEAASEGRVSSPLVQLDVARRVTTTRTGRVYELDGPPGVDADARYVLDAWLRIHRVPSWTDVTTDVLEHGLVGLASRHAAPDTP